MVGVGALVHYRCKPGFVLIGNESVRCMPDGAWSRPLPRCKGVFVRLSLVLLALLNMLSM